MRNIWVSGFRLPFEDSLSVRNGEPRRLHPVHRRSSRRIDQQTFSVDCGKIDIPNGQLRQDIPSRPANRMLHQLKSHLNGVYRLISRYWRTTHIYLDDNEIIQKYMKIWNRIAIMKKRRWPQYWWPDFGKDKTGSLPIDLKKMENQL